MAPNRRAVPAVTMVVTVALLVAGALVGWRALTAPVPEDAARAGVDEPRCDPDIAVGDTVRAADVTVSVYNAGSRPGLAGSTLNRLEGRGFLPGEARNAPRRLRDVEGVRVLAPTRRDPAGRLVALQFGPRTPVERAGRDLGPGIAVVVGDAFVGLVDAPRRLTARARGSGC